MMEAVSFLVKIYTKKGRRATAEIVMGVKKKRSSGDKTASDSVLKFNLQKVHRVKNGQMRGNFT